MEKVRAQYGTDFISLITEEFLAHQSSDCDLERLRAKIEEVREKNYDSLFLEMMFAQVLLAYKDSITAVRKLMASQELDSASYFALSEEKRLFGLVIDYDKRKISEAAREKAIKKHQLDPKGKAIISVYEFWQAWQKKPADFKNQTAFANAMLDRFTELESLKYIQDLCRIWKKGGKPRGCL